MRGCLPASTLATTHPCPLVGKADENGKKLSFQKVKSKHRFLGLLWNTKLGGSILEQAIALENERAAHGGLRMDAPLTCLAGAHRKNGIRVRTLCDKTHTLHTDRRRRFLR